MKHWYSFVFLLGVPVLVAGNESSVPAQMDYEAGLDCPRGQLRAMATDLHYPGWSCPKAVKNAESKLDSSHYQRACARALPKSKQRQKVLDAAVYSCREDAGAVVDVMVCCSAKVGAVSTQAASQPLDIWEALRRNKVLAIQQLISRQPDLAKARGKRMITPLHRVISLQMAKLLVSKGADLEARDDDGFTPLHSAVMRRNTPLVYYLLKMGAAIDPVSLYGDTPLSFASNRDMARLLLDHHAQVNGVTGARPLHAAAFSGRTEVVELLLNAGAAINGVDANGETALHRAVFRRYEEVVRLLLKRGAKVNVLDNAGRPRTALDMTDDPKIRRILTAHGAVSGRSLKR